MTAPDNQIKLWTRSMCLAVAVALIGVTVLLTGILQNARQIPLTVAPEKINPNTAPAASLVRLPGIGPARALDIIHYRTHVENQPAFQKAADMENIKGIGPKTAAQISPHLTFETQTKTK